jgi:prolipoprotein diacylglyceryltransferase
MAALQIGPLALPTSPLLWLGALLLSSALASRLAGPQARAAADAVWLAALAGFGVARAAFVIGAADAYLAAPWSAFDIRDGGWSPWAGVAAALAVLGAKAWRSAALRRALGAAALAGAAFWAAASTLLGVHERLALPALALQAGDGRSPELHPQGQGPPAGRSQETKSQAGQVEQP